jgi:hypothetical protein
MHIAPMGFPGHLNDHRFFRTANRGGSDRLGTSEPWPSISLDPDQPLDDIVNCIKLCEAALGESRDARDDQPFQALCLDATSNASSNESRPVPTRRLRRTFGLTPRVRVCGLGAGIMRIWLPHQSRHLKYLLPQIPYRSSQEQIPPICHRQNGI